ncbi:hypothetical protein Csa_001089 [Cucumis sativus]|uniref:Uncharacterized protein n=1 Tax=Cucumis sativus TaxID=3659 RepID=A0A0A0LAH5_CUCSA|nr:hypothetical protein Csa_001089 [Cucumis sativus]
MTIECLKLLDELIIFFRTALGQIIGFLDSISDFKLTFVIQPTVTLGNQRRIEMLTKFEED